MRRLGCCLACLVLAIVLSVSVASGQDLPEAQQISNWPAPALWSLPGKVMEKGEISPEAAEAVPTAPLHFVGLTPCRILDTRGNGFTGQYGPPALPQGAPRNFVLGGQCGISPTAQAVSLNITVTNTQGPGFILIYPQGGAQPNVSTLNYVGGETVANAAVVPLGTGGGVTVIAGVSGADLIIDTNGDYRAGVVTSVTAGTGLSGGGTGAVTISVAPGGGVPSGSSVLGTPNDSTLIAAGFTELGPSSQDVWSATTTTGAPTGRMDLTAVWTGVKMIVWGGRAVTKLNTGGQYDPVVNSWTLTTTTNAPTARAGHTAVWTGTRMIVWGGYDGAIDVNTGGQYDPIGNSWTATTTTNAPGVRELHTAVWTGTRMIVWGGYGGAGDVNTGGQYDPVGNSWTATTTTNAPGVREVHTAVWTGTRMIVWGGYDQTAHLNTGGQYDPVGNSWAAGGTATSGAPTVRQYHTAVWTGARMIIWGGQPDNASVLNSGGQYDPVGNSWTATTTTNAPGARTVHTAVWTGTRMIVWGGLINNGGGPLGTGAQYDPAGDSWAATSSVGAPTARYGHAAVWTGTRMIVWGGTPDGNTFLNTGSRFTTLSLYLKN